MQKDIWRDDFESDSTSCSVSWFEQEAQRLELDLGFSQLADLPDASPQNDTGSLVNVHEQESLSAIASEGAIGTGNRQNVPPDICRLSVPVAPSKAMAERAAVSAIRAKLSQNPSAYFVEPEIKAYWGAFKVIVDEWIKEGKSNQVIQNTFQIITRTLRNWRVKGTARKEGAGRKTNFLVETHMVSWCDSFLKNSGRQPQRTEVKAEAKKLAGPEFKVSKGWLDKFMNRRLKKQKRALPLDR